MNERDDFFYQAVVYAKDKDYRAARAMLRNLLFQYPEDIEGLLLYSIVAKNREGSIQALKRILQIDPDHEIAFAKLAKLKFAPPASASIPTPTAPLPIPLPISLSNAQADINQRKPLATRLKNGSLSPLSTQTIPRPTPPSVVKPAPAPKAPEEVIQRNTLETNKIIDPKNNSLSKKKRKKRSTFDIFFIGLLIITCLCISLLATERIFTLFLSGT